MQDARRRKKSGADAAALLADTNRASQHLAVLHVAFMVGCAYVLVIVFGTTDLDLLWGKNILNLLPRKMFAFDFAALQNENFGDLRDRLHVFPYLYLAVSYGRYPAQGTPSVRPGKVWKLHPRNTSTTRSAQFYVVCALRTGMSCGRFEFTMMLKP